jgi:hypothetical protein
MPALPLVPGVAKITYHGKVGARPIDNIMHVAFGTDFLSAAQCLAIADGMATKFLSRFGPRLSNDYALSATDCLDLGDELGNIATSAVTGAGTRGIPSLPLNVANCLTWHIGRHYRGGHPRSYFGPLTQADQADQTSWSAATTSGWIAAGNGFIADVAALFTAVPGPLELVCVHYRKGNAPLAVPTFDAITSCACDSRIDSQRRRLGKDR